MVGIYDFVVNLDWRQILIGGVVTALTLGVRTVVRAPVKAMTEHARAIRWLSKLSPQTPFGGIWEITWNVTASRFAEANRDEVRIYRLFRSVTFTTRTELLDGTPEACVFVGKLVDRTLTGRWYDPKDHERGYYGVFQVRLNGGLRDGRGAWSGWTNDGAVQSNAMTLRRTSD